ncbi:Cyclin-U2-1 [Camellia lanceoleosa]|nr:Cyclin-U2-1 [Camellia lanceoleosa]
MALSSASSIPISPKKLRQDVYSYTYQQDSNTPLVISVLASLIERTMARNKRIARNCKWVLSRNTCRTAIFDCNETPDLTIQSYLERILGITEILLCKSWGINNKRNEPIELDFLFLIGFKLHVNVSVFESYCCHLEREVSVGGGYQVERTLRCAEEIKSRPNQERGYDQIAHVLL